VAEIRLPPKIKVASNSLKAARPGRSRESNIANYAASSMKYRITEKTRGLEPRQKAKIECPETMRGKNTMTNLVLGREEKSGKCTNESEEFREKVSDSPQVQTQLQVLCSASATWNSAKEEER